jgi:hypothetical protein
MTTPSDVSPKQFFVPAHPRLWDPHNMPACMTRGRAFRREPGFTMKQGKLEVEDIARRLRVFLVSQPEIDLQAQIDFLCDAFIDLWQLMELYCVKNYWDLNRVRSGLIKLRELLLEAEARGAAVFVVRSVNSTELLESEFTGPLVE